MTEDDKKYIMSIIASFSAKRPLVLNYAIYAELKRQGILPNERVILRTHIPGTFLTGLNGYRKG